MQDVPLGGECLQNGKSRENRAELYTTKLEKGPQMRERERDAWRIMREIEGQSTKNLHLAEVKFLQDCVPHRALNSFSLWHKIYLEVLTG